MLWVPPPLKVRYLVCQRKFDGNCWVPFRLYPNRDIPLCRSGIWVTRHSTFALSWTDLWTLAGFQIHTNFSSLENSADTQIVAHVSFSSPGHCYQTYHLSHLSHEPRIFFSLFVFCLIKNKMIKLAADLFSTSNSACLLVLLQKK